MHLTIVKLKDGSEFEGVIMDWKPEKDYYVLVCNTAHGFKRLPFAFSLSASIITKGERVTIHSPPEGEDMDDLARAKQYLRDGRKYGWEGVPKKKFKWEDE